MDEYRTRDDALGGDAGAPGSDSRPRGGVAADATAPVEHLIPFVHVADVARSIACYELLGFAVRATLGPSDRLEWAALGHQQAKLMVARADSPVDSNGQGVLFYLYTHDLPALQTHLRAHWQPAGAIRDGTPGPRHEMRVHDPDGYVLIVAQLDGG